MLLKFGFIGIILTAILQVAIVHSPLIEAHVQYTPAQSRFDTATNATSVVDPGVEHQDYISEWNDKYDTVFITDPGYSADSNYTWKVASASEHNTEVAYYASFDEELSKYSNELLNGAGVQRIVFVEDLQFHNGQAVLGFADVLTGTIFYNIDGLRSNTSLLKSAMHHEIGHVAFYEAYGNEMYDVSDWPAAAADEARDGGNKVGYVNSYAETSVAEDMAEVYAYMMTDSLNDELLERMVEDEVLRNKVELVKNTMNSIDSGFIAPF